jgi:energy-converting hydrogenase B subunit D
VSVLELVSLTLVAIAGTAVVLVDDPLRQSMVMSFFGLALASTFFVLQAPDVALSMLAVGSVLIPLMVLLALARVREVVPEDGAEPAGDEDAG